MQGPQHINADLYRLTTRSGTDDSGIRGSGLGFRV